LKKLFEKLVLVTHNYFKNEVTAQSKEAV